LPKVSIITPLYNGEHHIKTTLDSVAKQRFADFEHLVIDNGSTDRGPEIVRSAATDDPRIRLLANPDKPGAGPTRNAGIEAATGDIIAFLDADDSWHPDKLAHQVAFMEDNNLAFSWTSYSSHDDDGNPLRDIRADRHASYEDLLYKRTAIGCLTAAYDTRLLGKHFMNNLPMRQDFCLWLDILKKAEDEKLAVGGLDQVLAYYRVHSGGMTSNKFRAAKMQWRAYREHVKLGRVATTGCFLSYAVRGVAQRLLKNQSQK
jgi:teichuronic acid biosynthesis glycosyltransferase TuaG